MAILPIVLYPDPTLRRVAEPVAEVTDEIKKILSDMADTMYEADGVGLAAPQIGVSLRLVVMDVTRDEDPEVKNLIKLVNPEIVESSGAVEWEEGCLSMPGIKGKVKRKNQLKLKALDENGKEIFLEGEGLFAVCVQHEIDHLDGTLFTDRLTPVRKQLVKSKLEKLRSSFRIADV